MIKRRLTLVDDSSKDNEVRSSQEISPDRVGLSEL